MAVITSGTEIKMTLSSVKLEAFKGEEGATFTCGHRAVKFSPNLNDLVSDLIFGLSGHLEFDYHGQHYAHDVYDKTIVTLGDEATFVDA